MKPRAWISFAVFVALVVGFVLWLPRSKNVREELAPLPPTADAKSDDQTRITLTPPDSTSQRESAAVVDEQTPSAPEAASEPTDTTTGEGLLRILVIAKESRAPLAGVRPTLFAKEDSASFGSEWIEGSRAELGESPQTDEQGRAEYTVPSGREFRLDCSASEFECESKQLDVPPLAQGEERDLVVELATKPDLLFFGRVVDAQTRQAVAHAHISQETRFRVRHAKLGSDPSASSTGIARDSSSEVEADGDGRFQLWTASWEPALLTIESAGYASTTARAGAGHESPENARIFELAGSATLRVHVSNVAGSPWSEVDVRLTTKPWYLAQKRDELDFLILDRGDPSWKAKTGADGIATLAELPPHAPLTLELWSSDKPLKLVPDAATLEPGETRDLSYELGRGARIVGRLLDLEGQPVARAMVWLGGAHLGPVFDEHEDDDVEEKRQTDDHGEFVIEDVAPGTWKIGPAPLERRPSRIHGEGQRDLADPRGVAPFTTEIVVAPSDREVPVTLRVARGLYISGRVVATSGEAPKFATVSASASDRTLGLWFWIQAEKDGTFAVGPLGEGEYDVVASSHDGDDCDSLPVRARAGASGVVLDLRAGGSLAGVTMDGASEAPVEARLVIGKLSKQWDGSMHVPHSKDGVFDLHGLEPGVYAVAASTSDGRVGVLAPITLASGQRVEDLEVRLAPGAEVVFTFSGPKGVAQCRLIDANGACVGVDSVLPGIPKSTFVPPGALTLSALVPPHMSELRRELHVEVGQRIELALDELK